MELSQQDRIEINTEVARDAMLRMERSHYVGLGIVVIISILCLVFCVVGIFLLASSRAAIKTDTSEAVSAYFNQYEAEVTP